MQPRVFVSHSNHDNEFTARFVADLRASGVDVWVDMDDVPSGQFASRINSALDKCDWFVLIVSQNSLTSPWVSREADAACVMHAKGRLKDILPVLAEEVDLEKIPPLWDTYVRFDAWRNYDAAVKAVCRAVSTPDAPTISAPPKPNGHTTGQQVTFVPGPHKSHAKPPVVHHPTPGLPAWKIIAGAAIVFVLLVFFGVLAQLGR